MIKKLDSKSKKSKNFDDFLKNYLIEKKEIKKDIGQLKKEFDDIKKHNYWITIGIAAFMLIFTAFNSYLYYNEVTYESLISDVTGLEQPKRMGDDELYQLKLHNYGSTEENLQITISFYLEVEFLKAYNLGEEARIIKEELRTGKSEYYVEYSKIHANEDIVIRLDIASEELKQNESVLVYPYSIEAYTDAGKIQIYRSSE